MTSARALQGHICALLILEDCAVNPFHPVLSYPGSVIINLQKISTNGRQTEILLNLKSKKKKKFPLVLTKNTCITLYSLEGSEDPSELMVLRGTKYRQETSLPCGPAEMGS